MQNVSDILAFKGDQVCSVTPDATVFEALTLMSEKNIGSVIVLDEDKLVGILTERIYARKVALENKVSKDILVKEIMATRVLCVNPNRSVEECMALMSDKGIRHLPVVDHKKVIGMISIGDLVKAIIHDQKILIDQLQNYITG